MMWDFMKRNKVMFLIGGLICIIAIGAVIYAVATREGDVGFAKRDGHELKWNKSAFPLSCFYEEKFDQGSNWRLARAEPGPRTARAQADRSQQNDRTQHTFHVARTRQKPSACGLARTRHCAAALADDT